MVGIPMIPFLLIWYRIVIILKKPKKIVNREQLLNSFVLLSVISVFRLQLQWCMAFIGLVNGCLATIPLWWLFSSHLFYFAWIIMRKLIYFLCYVKYKGVLSMLKSKIKTFFDVIYVFFAVLTLVVVAIVTRTQFDSSCDDDF